MKKRFLIFNNGGGTGNDTPATSVEVNTPAAEPAPSGDTNVTVNTGSEGSQEGK